MLTDEQQEIIAYSRHLDHDDCIKIDACAGSGKTTTLMEVAKANPDSKYLYLAFNRAIVDEAKDRFPENVTVKTVHALAYQHMIHNYPDNKLISKYEPRDLKEHPAFREFSYLELSSLVDHFEVFCNSNFETSIYPEVNEMFRLVSEGELPRSFNFMLKDYELKETHREFQKFDAILLDEAQDTNQVTLSLITKAKLPLMIVGDTHQSIYNFRGSYNALSKFKSTIKFNLTHSFRSRQEILDQANFFLKKYAFDADELKPMVSDYQEKKIKSPTTATLSRTNAKLIYCIAAIEHKRKYSLLRDPKAIFGLVINLYNLKKHNNKIWPEYAYLKKFDNLSEFEEYVEEIEDQEKQTALKALDNFQSQIFSLYSLAQEIYGHKQNATHFLTTAHCAKGLEFNQVILQDDFKSLKDMYESFKEGKLMMSYEDFQQELNLYYMGITRAKEELEDHTGNKEYMQHLALLKNPDEK